MFTLVAFSEVQDNASLAYITALPDQHVTVDGDDVIVPTLNKMLGWYAVGPNLTQAQISAPSLRDLILIDVEPLDVASEPSSRPPLHDRFDNPLPLVTNEALNALAAEDGTGATRETMLIWLGDGPVQPISGEIHTLRATGATTLTAGAWTAVPLTLSQQLPAGRYALVGLRAQSAGLIAARAIFPGGIWRPGVIGFDSDADIDPQRFRYGNAGVFGEFQHNTLPQIECLSISADTSQVFHLDIVKIS